MATDLQADSKTWDEIDSLIWRIEERALQARDWDTAKDADRISRLLRNLASEARQDNRPAR